MRHEERARARTSERASKRESASERARERERVRVSARGSESARDRQCMSALWCSAGHIRDILGHIRDILGTYEDILGTVYERTLVLSGFPPAVGEGVGRGVWG